MMLRCDDMLQARHPGGSGNTEVARRRQAFTLVEILIVVVVLGILAAIAIPKLSNASQAASQNSLKEDMRYLRTQIAVYGSNHHDTFPGYPGGDTSQAPSEAAFVQQMTEYTDEAGDVSATASNQYKLGPYLTKMPANPLNNLSTVKIIGAGGAMTADGTTGWLYQPTTGALLPNLTGSDSDGTLFSSY